MKKKIIKANSDNLINEWNRTRDIYQNWVANTELKDFFYKNIKYDNFSLWWICNLVNKDNELDNTWYINLHNVLLKKKKIKKKFNFFINFLKLLKNFFFTLLFNFIIQKLSFTRYLNISYINCFHSYDYHLKNDKKKIYDNLFGVAPIKKLKKKNIYLIQIIKYLNFFRDLTNIKKRKFLQKNFILNEFISIKEIIDIYYKIFILYFKCANFLNKNKVFILNKNFDCSNVLEPFLLKSFFGSIQSYLITSIAIKNFLNQNNSIKNFISYGAFLPGYCSNYFFIKKTINPPFVVTIQHAYSHENKLFYQYSPNEFCKKNIDNSDSFYHPCPDLFFVQGSQYKKILKGFFKNKIKIIGALNRDVDNLYKNRSKLYNIKFNNLEKIILICPSVGDEEILFNFFNKIKHFSKDFKFILCPHPTSINKVLKLFKESIELSEIEYYSNLTTNSLLPMSFLVISSLSAVAFDALLFGIHSIRVFDRTRPPVFSDIELSPIIENKRQFSFFLKNLPSKHHRSIIKKLIIKDLFYKLDNNSYLRFWIYLQKFNNIK